MNPSLTSLEEQREQVLEQMRSIDRLHRGTLSQHFLRRQRGGKTVTHGPYFVLQGYFQGKKFSRHVPAEKAAEVGQHVENYQRFQALAGRFVTLTEQITRLAEGGPQSKKNSSSRKSPTNASGRPKRS
jgi:hypothetical protein